ncbi:AP-2 complex subunit sigma, putative [Plasmodium chabaudi chabaudi]|uniref:AP complex subunit sigma n=2 Tax=Plasmodium chabaudi TaxID=5825 RepID=A0A077TJ15_PLACU|nr:AP-2 complex subunit sigma, putative [Plasmodium chabaudi chabaudi]SCM00777.1 AP-2 complex subunit sigma, putative [Plasmodium chabaudi adami]SCL97727.1 AP-2 complex subunit sigma, putative [Plasmodium chabaudi chabaudi]SCL98051.1 AP-2 complex subunit sigma, putative [Plasmodium chabaudi chabaudi]SCM05497.1 AP-2 complex subunit sigma, putative [Plasmodium chabaudi adami]VTZ67079.1 AP-2 complex subunit sigma, putative [Plasmodium chabaudi chabaudi]|eukprot:XP_016653226.1 AP-2 complex subunit sigma, putative [Plasmodium chabaudi chabaudi]
MINFILFQNRQGKTIFSKWYINCDEGKRKQIERNINKILINRSAAYANVFVYEQFKIIYRLYAGLYFIVCIENENELYILEFIQFMAQILDAFFTNVCELDLLFNFHLLYYFFDNIILGGYIYELNKNIILDKISKIKKIL